MLLGKKRNSRRMASAQVMSRASSAGRYWPLASMVPVAKPHFHEYPEILGFYGSDPYNPWDLGGEVEFWVGGEQHILTKSTMVYLPPNVPHCPLIINRVDKPIFHYSVVMNAIYSFKDDGAGFRAE